MEAAKTKRERSVFFTLPIKNDKKLHTSLCVNIVYYLLRKKKRNITQILYDITKIVLTKGIFYLKPKTARMHNEHFCMSLSLIKPKVIRDLKID